MQPLKSDAENTSSSSSSSSSLSSDDEEYKKMRKLAEVGERGAIEWLKRKRRERMENKNRAVKGNRKALNEASAAGRKRREENRYLPTSPVKEKKPWHELTGTRRKLSIPVEDRLKELFPYCSMEQIIKCVDAVGLQVN